jgi:hypothetical protein
MKGHEVNVAHYERQLVKWTRSGLNEPGNLAFLVQGGCSFSASLGRGEAN